MTVGVCLHPPTGENWECLAIYPARSVRSATQERTQEVKTVNDITIRQTYESIGYEAALPTGSYTATYLWFGCVGADDARREVPEVALVAMVIGDIHRRLHRKCCR